MIDIKSIIKATLIACGCISLLLGALGIFVPLLPTTPFVLLAAACFSRSSEKFYNKLLQNKWLGLYVKNYMEGKGIPIKAKVLSLLILWATIGYLSFFLLSVLWVRILIIIVAMAVTVHVLSVKTFQSKLPENK